MILMGSNCCFTDCPNNNNNKNPCNSVMDLDVSEVILFKLGLVTDMNELFILIIV